MDAPRAVPRFRISVVGGGHAGKSSLTMAFINGRLTTDEFDPTLGTVRRAPIVLSRHELWELRAYRLSGSKRGFRDTAYAPSARSPVTQSLSFLLCEPKCSRTHTVTQA